MIAPNKNEIKGIGVLPWNTCNAMCAHCGTSSTQQDKSGIEHEKMLDLIEQAATLYGSDWCLALSGGEIFIHYDRMRQYINLTSKLGGYSTVISNCFWATSVEHAVKILHPLVLNNLRLLGISADKFHEPFVSYLRIKNAIKAAKILRLPVEVRATSSMSNRLSDIVKKIEDCQPWFVRFMEMPLLPYGRASKIHESEFITMKEIPTQPCPAPSLTINHDGAAMFCCNGDGCSPMLQAGNIYKDTLLNIQNAYDRSKILEFLVENGPAKALNLLRKIDADILRKKKFVDQCHLCIELFGNDDYSHQICTSIVGP